MQGGMHSTLPEWRATVEPTTQEVDVPAEEIDDIKAKMRHALKSKQANDRGGDDSGKRKEEKAPETHGPRGGVHMHRRKAGGGGS
jgi:Family of unknown function (DUF5302)